MTGRPPAGAVPSPKPDWQTVGLLSVVGALFFMLNAAANSIGDGEWVVRLVGTVPIVILLIVIVRRGLRRREEAASDRL